MASTLHLLVEPPDALTRALLEAISSEGEAPVVDLTVPSPDYEAAVIAVFAHESVATW